MRYLLLFLVLVNGAAVFSQATDSVVIDSADVADLYQGDTEKSYKDVHGDNDSLQVTHRQFSETEISELKSDAELQYEEIPTVAESLLDRLLAFIKYLWRKLLSAALGTSVGNVVIYVGGFIVVVLLVLMLLKVNAFQIFYGKQAAGAMGATQFEENIHEMDFEALILEATRNNDYRRGIRLVFLYALKILSDKQLIIWEQGKTNHDYVAELQKPELKEGLHELSYYFDYAWYGNFKVSAEVFGKVQNVFKNWRGNIR